MGEFTYINIYSTKGVEYLWVISYLLLIAVLAPIFIRMGRAGGGTDADEGGE